MDQRKIEIMDNVENLLIIELKNIIKQCSGIECDDKKAKNLLMKIGLRLAFGEEIFNKTM